MTDKTPTRPKVDLPALRKDPKPWMAMRSPVKAALWLALSQPAKDTIHKAEQIRRFIAQQKGELEDGFEVTAPEDLSVVELATIMVAKGLGGDMTALTMIAERVEGKVGLRQDDISEDDPRQKQQLHAVTESLVAALTKAALQQRGVSHDAKVIDVEAIDTPKKSE